MEDLALGLRLCKTRLSRYNDSEKAMGWRGSVRLQVPVFPWCRLIFERERANAQAMYITEILRLLLVALLCLLGCRHDKDKQLTASIFSSNQGHFVGGGMTLLLLIHFSLHELDDSDDCLFRQESKG